MLQSQELKLDNQLKCQNNQITQEQMISLNTGLMIDVIQELNHIIKEFTEKRGVMLNSLTTLITKMT